MNNLNILFIGHSGSGKTSFIESVLKVTGVIEKKGTVEQKNTTSDYLPEEKDHMSSISTSIIPVEYNGYKLKDLEAKLLDISFDGCRLEFKNKIKLNMNNSC